MPDAIPRRSESNRDCTQFRHTTNSTMWTQRSPDSRMDSKAHDLLNRRPLSGRSLALTFASLRRFRNAMYGGMEGHAATHPVGG